ncbi:hypothetical protein RND71_005509 [Anisodus tanguticus]|uniref:Hexosyltransferase n=1 Tax=Anisodus tanguticus TaxID=243964 RepID=A0AAE1SRP0_9SOLA|nr:hypothetical protein RND71_005509 [Anisodus tanguticus]
MSELLRTPPFFNIFKNSLCFSYCFPHRHRCTPPPPSSSDEHPALIWVNPEEPNNLKDKILTALNFVSNRHKRHSSTEFRYDPLSYLLNFEDGLSDNEEENAHLRKFSSRLPHSPPGKVKHMSVREEKSRSKEVQQGQNVQSHPWRALDEKVKEVKDQLISAKAFLNFVPAGSNSNFVKEIKLRIKDLERAAGEVSKDSGLSRSKLFPECSSVVKKLRAMTYNAEEQLRSKKNQASFLVNLVGRTTPKGLHCLSMRLTTEYFALQPEEQKLPNQHKLQNPDLYHFVVFSDNVLACSAVVNSAVSTARAPEKIVFHIVTDSLNLPAMTMWFLSNPPGKATIQVQSIDRFDWLSNKDILQKQESVDPKYTSPLNHLRFYLPDIFPSLNKIVLLDHDVVVKRDLSGLWHINMKGKVNGAVETCLEGEPSFRRMDMLINFTDPMVATRFGAKSCTWAFGMNMFDLQMWRKRNFDWSLSQGSNRPLMKAGALPIGWMTFYKHTRAISEMARLRVGVRIWCEAERNRASSWDSLRRSHETMVRDRTSEVQALPEETRSV